MQLLVRSLCGSALALSGLVSAATAQNQVWVVDQAGSGDFTDFGPALVAAGDGDVLLVKSGDYGTPPDDLTIDGMSLSVVADAGANVRLVFRTAIRNLASDQRVVLHGLRLDPLPPPEGASGPGLVMNDCDGAVWIVDCDVRGDGANTGLEATDCDRIVVSDCEVRGSSAAFGPGGPFFASSGIVATNSNLQLFDCTVAGADGITSSIPSVPSGPGAHGIGWSGGDLFVDRTTVSGGDGGDGADLFGSCLSPAAGGDAVHVVTASTIRTVEPNLVAGNAGTPAAGCPDGTDGSALGGPGLGASTVTNLPDAARLMEIDSPVREGQTLNVHFEGPPLEFAFLVLSGAPEVSPTTTFVADLLVTQPWVLEFVGVIQPDGSADVTLTAGSISPALESLEIFAQGFTVDLVALTTQLASPGDVVVLDSSF